MPSILSGNLEGTHSYDFTTQDAYIDDGSVFHGLIYEESEQFKKSTSTLQIAPQRQDVGNNPLEQRPEFGDFFAQGDFSGGANQSFFHLPGRDERKYLRSEGFDISKIGKLSHLPSVSSAYASPDVGNMAVADSKPFVTDGVNIRSGDGTFPGNWSLETSVHVAEGNQTVLWLAGGGALLFAACGSNGVHVRSSAAVWSHYQPDAATNLNVGAAATSVAWLKDRLMVIGGTNARSIYEVVASSTPTAMEVLAEGWSFTQMFEAGAFIMAVSQNASIGQSQVHAYGLNAAGSALEKKTSTAFPRGDIMYAGKGYVGRLLVGGGRQNIAGGLDPVIYEITDQDALGNLQFSLLHVGEGSGAADLSVRSLETLPDSIVFGWSLAAGDPGGPRTGVGIRNLGRSSFAHYLASSTTAASRITSVILYKGRLLFSVTGIGVFYETTTLVSDAWLQTSIANWNSAGNKVWDLFRVEHNPLPAAGLVELDYASTDPDESPVWNSSLKNDTTGSTGKRTLVSRLVSKILTIRIRSTKGTTEAPVTRSYAIRSNPVPEVPEYQLTRYIRIHPRDRKNHGEWVYNDSLDIRSWLESLANSWVVLHESGITWTAFVRSSVGIEPILPQDLETSGSEDREGYVIEMQMVATKAAA